MWPRPCERCSRSLPSRTTSTQFSKSIGTGASAEAEDWILIGRIRGAHGVRGELAVEPMTDFPQRFSHLESVYLGDRHAEYPVLSARTKGRIFLMLGGVETREDARRLSNREIWVPRDQAMPLPEGEYYADEIVGLMVVLESGEVLGPVVDLITTGANDVYVVRNGNRDVLIPAI